MRSIVSRNAFTSRAACRPRLPTRTPLHSASSPPWLTTRASKEGTAMSDSELQSLAEQIMKADPIAAAQLQRVQEAADRVARAQAAMKEFEQMSMQTMAEASSLEQQKIQEANDYLAAAEVQAAQKLMQAAELEVSSAEATRLQLAASARKDEERMESVKGGAAALVGGAAASIPLVLASPLATIDMMLVTVATDLVSALLFGVTYRYIIRSQPNDSHLRSGAVGAFAIVRGMGGVELLTVTGRDSNLLDAVSTVAIYIGESFLVFAFAAGALEVAIQRGLVKASVEQDGS